MSETAWKVEQPSRYGGTRTRYFRTRHDAYAYAPFMEDFGARAELTEVPATEVTEYTTHPTGRADS